MLKHYFLYNIIVEVIFETAYCCGKFDVRVKAELRPNSPYRLLATTPSLHSSSLWILGWKFVFTNFVKMIRMNITYLSWCTWRRLSRHRRRYGLRCSNTCWTEISFLPQRNVHTVKYCPLESCLFALFHWTQMLSFFSSSATVSHLSQREIFCLQLENIPQIIKY